MPEGDELAQCGGVFAFDFFEVVSVDPPSAPHLRGRTGTVLGRSRDEDGAEFYVLAFDDEPSTWMAEGQSLVATGRRRRREDFYDGSTIRVSTEGQFLGGL